jgi:putrescine aminotransferase
MTALKNYDSDDLRAKDAAHHMHPFTDHKALAGEGSRIITRAEGCYVWDTDGNKILDGMAGLWCVNVGYGREELAKVAYDQLVQLPYYNTFFKTTTPPVTELAHALADLLPPGFDHIFFNNSGSEANDTVYRLVRRFWGLAGKPEKTIFISRWNGYHGSTVVGASLGGMKFMHEQSGLPLPGFEHIMQPYWFGEGGDTDKDAFGLKAAKALEDRILELGPDNVAAFVAEPVQGAGGVVIPPDSYWPEINRICKKYDVLLVCDEVICGFGRTGNWFGHQTYGIEPDLISMAKGLSSGYLPISAVGVSARVAEILHEEGGEFAHGYTYSGHPAACAVALRNIEIMQREKLVEKVRDETGPHLAKALQSLADHPIVGEVRSVGLLGAFELVADKTTRARFEPAGRAGTVCRDNCFANNAVMRACGETMVMSPPLTIEKEQIDDLIGIAHIALDATAGELGVTV